MRIQFVGGGEEQLDVHDELLGGHDAVHVGAVADMEQHIGDAGGGLLLEGGERLPDPVDLGLNLLFLLAHGFTHSFGGIALGILPALRDGLPRRVQTHIPVLVDHVALWVPVLVLAIAEDFDELLEDGRLAAVAALCELGRVVVVAVDAALVLIVAVRGAEDGGADGAGEVLDVVFAVEGGDVGAAQGLATVEAEQVEPAKVVGFAEGVLAGGLLGDGEELGGDDLAAVLHAG